MYSYHPSVSRSVPALPYPSPLFHSQLTPALPVTSLPPSHPPPPLDGPISLPPFAHAHPAPSTSHTVCTPPALPNDHPPPPMSLPIPVRYPPLSAPRSSPLALASLPSALPAAHASSATHPPNPAPQPPPHTILYDVAKLLSAGCTVFGGRVYNGQGHIICGMLNQHEDPCRRIGKCPFHSTFIPVSSHSAINMHLLSSATTKPAAPILTQATSPVSSAHGSNAPRESAHDLPPRKQQFKRGWTKEEHYLFLLGLQQHGRGNWKKIAEVIPSRTATQVQSHAQKYYKRRDQKDKRKRSIHDLHLGSDELEHLQGKYEPESAALPQWQPLLERPAQPEAPVNNSGMVGAAQAESVTHGGVLAPHAAFSSLSAREVPSTTQFSSFASSRGAALGAQLASRTRGGGAPHISDAYSVGAAPQPWAAQRALPYAPAPNASVASRMKMMRISNSQVAPHEQGEMRKSMATGVDGGGAHYDRAGGFGDNRRGWWPSNNGAVPVGVDMWRAGGEWGRD